MIRSLFIVSLVLWAGSLWSAALWVAPTLFTAQADRHLAGLLAGRLFSIEAYVGIAVSVFAVLLPVRAKFLRGYLAAALLALDQWGLRPLMDRAHAQGAFAGLTFVAWHAVSAVIYGLACLALVVLVWREEFR